jgi:hypothetical protein
MRAIENIIQQIEGETRTGGNTKERVGAVLRLLKGKLEQFLTLFNGKLDKGNYEGTANDLANAIDRKVDKVQGKILSSNDFTNELRRKLEGLQQVDISVLLPRGNFSGTAQELKELIDNIMRILQSPDTELDELREIVAYIKQNKRTLDTLGINNIAGLQDALNGKAPNDHHHDDRYSQLGHTHTEYAYRTHRHNWDDIEGKPDPLLSKMNHSEYGEVLDASRPIKTGEVFIENGDSKVNIWADDSELNVGSRKAGGHTTIKTSGYKVQGKGSDDVLLADGTTISKGMLLGREGLERYDWTVTKEYQNRIVFVPRSGFIELHTIEHLGSVSFRKVFAGGQVTFTCQGKEIIYTGDTSFNGGDGSTAVVSVWNNKCYIDIRNI